MNKFILIPLAISLISAPVMSATFIGTVTAYCLGPCKQCGTSGQTATGSRKKIGGAAINRKLAIPALRKAREVRVMTSRGWGPWRKIDDTGRGPKKVSLRKKWVDLRIYVKGHHSDPMGMKKRKIQTR